MRLLVSWKSSPSTLLNEPKMIMDLEKKAATLNMHMHINRKADSVKVLSVGAHCKHEFPGAQVIDHSAFGSCKASSFQKRRRQWQHLLVLRDV